jgi:hypothetical protein
MDSSLTLELLDKLENQGFDAAFSKVHHHREKGEDRTIQRFRSYINSQPPAFRKVATIPSFTVASKSFGMHIEEAVLPPDHRGFLLRLRKPPISKTVKIEEPGLFRAI